MSGITIQQAAAQTGLSTYTLRYYEEIGLLPAIERAANGHRRYKKTDLGWVDYVLCLKAVGMPLEDIKCYVKLQTEDDVTTLPERVQLLEAHRDAIRQQTVKIEEGRDAGVEKGPGVGGHGVLEGAEVGKTSSSGPGPEGLGILEGGREPVDIQTPRMMIVSVPSSRS